MNLLELTDEETTTLMAAVALYQESMNGWLDGGISDHSTLDRGWFATRRDRAIRIYDKALRAASEEA